MFKVLVQFPVRFWRQITAAVNTTWSSSHRRCCWLLST